MLKAVINEAGLFFVVEIRNHIIRKNTLKSSIEDIFRVHASERYITT